MTQEIHALKINIFSERNGKGLEVDQRILAEALTELGCEVECTSFSARCNKSFHSDINIFFEKIASSWLQTAPLNWFVPNPEWYMQDIKLLRSINLILCRTKEVERIFQNLNKKTYFTGFTSPDCYDPTMIKDYKSFFHLAGPSAQKGTIPLLNIWVNNPQLPTLVAIYHYKRLKFNAPNLQLLTDRVETPVLRRLQNYCGIHICASETEGFGHSMMESLSTGAVIVTTNAPPMNEFTSDFLVPYQHTSRRYLATNYYVNQNALEETIKKIMNMPPEELEAIGKKNREAYLEKTRQFKTNLQALISPYLGH